ncbi:MAG: AccI family restriction endonuclease [Candidatus Syntrophoarchaeum sp.]|nr:AccI family restriction endonuclease [Candidatus Syntrophoarchaeum sp.]
MNGEYVKEIEELIKDVSSDIVNFGLRRRRGNVPTQAFSEFLTNREQGDWAEDLIFSAINENDNGIIAVRYGKSDQVVAGEPGFKEFYERYQDELDQIGKRPDLLIFRKEDFDLHSNFDIGHLKEEKLNNIVPKAIAGLEIRSSSFLVNKYNEFSLRRRQEIINEIRGIIESLRSQCSRLPEGWMNWLFNIDVNDESTLFAIPRTPIKVESIKSVVKELRNLINSLKKRDFLSFTPKVEDIYVIYNGIKIFGVPHYYVQVFFDKVYAISFKRILEIISIPSNEGKRFFVERSAKNQFKRTIHIDITQGILLAEKVEFPNHKSEYKELGRGRLLFYVTFKGGKAYLDVGQFYEMIGLSSTGCDII